MKLWSPLFTLHKYRRSLISSHQKKVFLLSAIGLLDQLTRHQTTVLMRMAKTQTFSKDDLIAREGDEGQNLFILEKGEAIINHYDPENDVIHPVSKIGPGSTFGELGVLDGLNYPANLTALTDCSILILPMSALQEKHPDIFLIVSKNMTRSVVKHYRNINNLLRQKLVNEVRLVKNRMAMGSVTLALIGIIAVYILVSTVIESFSSPDLPMALWGAPVLAVFALVSVFAMKTSGFPMAYFGLTARHGIRHSIEAVLFSIPILFISILIKKFFLLLDGNMNQSLFFFSVQFYPHLSIAKSSLYLLIYIALIPLQEMMIRGALQTSLSEFVHYKHRNFWSIFVTSLLFGAMHSHVSVIMSIATFLLSLFWGWLYAKQRSLIGVIVSHTLIAVWFFYILGIPQIVYPKL